MTKFFANSPSSWMRGQNALAALDVLSVTGGATKPNYGDDLVADVAPTIPFEDSRS